MPPLRELQREFASALLSGEAPSFASMDRFEVYRTNREAALINALRLTYPAVSALVGEAFFTAVAREFAQQHPPASALLTLYGANFPDHLAAHPQLTDLPYLPEVARLEWGLAQVSQQSRGYAAARFTVGAIAIRLSASLNLLTLRFCAAAIWRAALDADEAALARVVVDPSPSAVAIWRVGAGAGVVELSATAATFVSGLLRHGDVAAALMKAATHTADPIPIITDEVLRANFACLEPVPN